MPSLTEAYDSIKNFYTPMKGEQGVLDSLITWIKGNRDSGFNPYVAARQTTKDITPDQYNQIMSKEGYVDQWKQDAKQKSVLGTKDTSLSDMYTYYNNQVKDGTATTIPFKVVEDMRNKGLLPENQTPQTTPPVKSIIPTYSEEQRNKAINYFLKNAGSVDPNSPNRSTPQKAQENVAYVQEYLNEFFKQAPLHNLDPMMLTAIAAQESGWGGTRYGNNLIGYGKFEVGKSLDTDYSEKSIANAVSALLKKVSTDWEGQYQNKTTPQGFVEGQYKWNTHPSWVQNVGIIRNNLN